ncbi:MAG: hypothetical protein JNM38_12095 [Acidobacteria bacterium]|nr:hypothetical protein [Acidobacteriota bacterium]
MTERTKRKLADGREDDVGKNHGLRKICACARRNWTKCPHSWHFSYRWQERDYRFSIDRHLRRRVESKSEAEAEAERIRVAIRAGQFGLEVPEPEPVERVPVGTTFKELADIWIARERTGRGRMEANEQARTKALAAIELLPGRLLGAKLIDAVCEDDLETAIRQIRERGFAASTLNHYIQTLRSMQRWALRKGHRNWIAGA